MRVIGFGADKVGNTNTDKAVGSNKDQEEVLSKDTGVDQGEAVLGYAADGVNLSVINSAYVIESVNNVSF